MAIELVLPARRSGESTAGRETGPDSESVRASSRSYFETILKNRFYLGYFVWQGVEYKGTHQPLISGQLFDQVQDVFAGPIKAKHRKHAFAFAGLLKCVPMMVARSPQSDRKASTCITAARMGAGQIQKTIGPGGIR